MKKVLFAIPTLGGGGAERVLVTLLNNLNTAKYDITLFAIFDGGINKKFLNETIHYQFYFRKVFRGNVHLFKLFSPNKLYSTMIKDQYDIIVSYLEGPMTRIVGGCTNPQSKLLNWVHTAIDDSKIITQSYRNLHEAIDCYNKFYATVFVSNTARVAFETTFKDIRGNFLVKYNTVDNSLIISKSKEQVDDIQFDNNKINCISVGRFIQEKGYIRLLRIIKLLANQGIKVHLFLLGKGELEHEYYKFIDRYGLHNYVTILGFKDNPYKYIKRCSLFICSSYHEGYSTAVTESLIVGTPVVTTLCSGMEEMLGSNSEYGLITANDEAALYQGVKRMLTEPRLLQYYKEKATERGKYFSAEQTVQAVEKLLDDL